MAVKDTPPVSPSSFLNEESEEEEAVLEEDQALEVIDLDEHMDDSDADDFSDDEIPDNSTSIFKTHRNSVFSVDIRPGDRGRLEVVSGDEDDQAYLWDVETEDVKLVCDGFKDSVTYTRFNHDGNLVAVADLSGVIKVYKISSSSVVWEFETADIMWMEWHPGSNVLFAGTVESECWMWKIPTGESKIFMGSGEQVECASILPDGKRIAVGYRDGSVKVFDLKKGDVQINTTNDANAKHETAVSCIDSNSCFIGYGSLDGSVKIISSQSGKVIANFSCGMDKEEDEMDEEVVSSSIECLLFSKDHQSSHQHLYLGSLSGKVLVWDVSSQSSRHSSILGSGIVKMLIRNKVPSQLIVATLDGSVIIYDTLEGKVLGSCTGHKGSILDVQQTKNGLTLITSSDDGTCRVFDVNNVIEEGISS